MKAAFPGSKNDQLFQNLFCKRTRMTNAKGDRKTNAEIYEDPDLLDAHYVFTANLLVASRPRVITVHGNPAREFMEDMFDIEPAEGEEGYLAKYRIVENLMVGDMMVGVSPLAELLRHANVAPSALSSSYRIQSISEGGRDRRLLCECVSCLASCATSSALRSTSKPFTKPVLRRRSKPKKIRMVFESLRNLPQDIRPAVIHNEKTPHNDFDPELIERLREYIVAIRSDRSAGGLFADIKRKYLEQVRDASSSTSPRSTAKIRRRPLATKYDRTEGSVEKYRSRAIQELRFDLGEDLSPIGVCPNAAREILTNAITPADRDMPLIKLGPADLEHLLQSHNDVALPDAS